MLFFSGGQLVYFLLSIVIAFTIHEFAHAYVATKFGDPTPGRQGRLTLNPMAHIDLFGFLFLLLAGFGWAKPVQVNYYYFKNPKLAGISTTIAGPASNLLLAFIGMIGYFSAVKMSGSVFGPMPEFLNVFVFVNLLLCIFNLLPLPPLDGYRIIENLLPRQTKLVLSRYEQYGMFVLLILVITPLRNYTIRPIFNTVIPAIIDGFGTILAPIFF